MNNIRSFRFYTLICLSFLLSPAAFPEELPNVKIEEVAPETGINRDPNTPEGWSHYSEEPLLKLDLNPRAQDKGRAYFLYATHKQIEAMKRNFDPSSFGMWVEKLKAIHPSMTVEEIKTALASKTPESMVTFGAGVIVCFQLDDAYFVHGLFDEKSRLRDMTSPIAISYYTSLRRKVAPSTQ